MNKKPRMRLFIDRSVQGALVRRVTVYWASCMFGTFALLAGIPIVMNWFIAAENGPTALQLSAQAWRTFWPVFFASGLVLPILLYDVLRVSHRFVGPVYRLRAALSELASGKSIKPIHFREHDFWEELAEQVNHVAIRFQNVTPRTTQAEQSVEATPTSQSV